MFCGHPRSIGIPRGISYKSRVILHAMHRIAVRFPVTPEGSPGSLCSLCDLPQQWLLIADFHSFKLLWLIITDAIFCIFPTPLMILNFVLYWASAVCFWCIPAVSSCLDHSQEKEAWRKLQDTRQQRFLVYILKVS